MRVLRQDLKELLIVLRENISRNHGSVLGTQHSTLVERIEKMIPSEESPFRIDKSATPSRSDWGLNSDATVGEVLEAMHERIFGFGNSSVTRDLDDILVSEESMRLTEGQEESFPVPPDIPLDFEEKTGDDMKLEKDDNREHFILPSNPPGLEEDEDDEEVIMGSVFPYQDVMMPPPGIDDRNESKKPIEFIDESERDRRRLEGARRRSRSSSSSPGLKVSEAMRIGQRNNFDSPKAVVMDFSNDTVSQDAQHAHERAIRRRLRNRQKKKEDDTIKRKTSDDEKIFHHQNQQMSEIDRTSAAIDRLQNELETNRTKAKELETKLRLSNQMSRLRLSSKISSEKKMKKKKQMIRKPLPPLSLDQTWLSTPASKLPRASVVFNSVMNSLSKDKKYEKEEKEEESKMDVRHNPLSEKEISMMQTFRGRYGKRRVGADVEPIADEENIMSSKHFHMKLMGMSPLSRHPEPYSGVESPHARLWDFKPTEYTEPEALNSNVLIPEIEGLKQRTPSRKRRGGRR